VSSVATPTGLRYIVLALSLTVSQCTSQWGARNRVSLARSLSLTTRIDNRCVSDVEWPVVVIRDTVSSSHRSNAGDGD
jgi:hypothetical protein